MMLDISFQYYPIFSVELSHAYYNAGILPNTEFKPLPATEALLQKLGLLFRFQDNKFFVLYDQHEAHKLIYTFQNTHKNLKLYFAIQHQNPYFNIISNLPYTTTQKIYLSNTQKKFLSKSEAVSEKDLIDFFDVRLLARSLASDKKVTLKNEAGEMVLEGLAKDIDLERVTTGIYHIAVEKGLNQKVLLFNNPSMTRLPLALVEITLSESMIKEMVSSLKLENPVKPENYQIQFTTRKVHWKYYLIPKYANNVTDIHITKHLNVNSAGDKVEKIAKSKEDEKHKLFKPLEDELYKGTKAQVFVSIEAMPIKENYEEVYSLNFKAGTMKSNMGMIKKLLPVPSMDLIETKNGKEYIPIVAYY